ncbi:MAG TPA: hypothetical protein PK324_02470, partial [Nocardioides sp.]|nr:hypothetical protein [Nocardioides sp.]
RAQPRKFSRIGPSRLEALLGDRGPTESNPVEEGAEHPPGTAATDAHPDDPTDPTDQESGDAPPLQDPVAPPPVAPPVAPPPDND